MCDVCHEQLDTAYTIYTSGDGEWWGYWITTHNSCVPSRRLIREKTYHNSEKFQTFLIRNAPNA